MKLTAILHLNLGSYAMIQNRLNTTLFAEDKYNRKLEYTRS